jgi:hypothetical protein
MRKLWIGMNERGWENYDNLLLQTRGITTTIALWTQMPEGTLLWELGSQLSEVPFPARCQLSASARGMGALPLVHPGYALPSGLHAYVLTMLDSLTLAQSVLGTGNSSISECIGKCVEAHRFAASRFHANSWRLRESVDEPVGRGVEWRLAAISSPY